MLPEGFPTGRKLLYAFGAFILAGFVAATVFVLSGVYPVGANRGHIGVTTWLLLQVRERSIATYSTFVDPRPVDDPDMAMLGAAHYEGGCAPCHGRPGGPVGVIPAQMLPPPPQLHAALADRESDRQIFWIVKNGLKYTGMPAWPACRCISARS